MNADVGFTGRYYHFPFVMLANRTRETKPVYLENVTTGQSSFDSAFSPSSNASSVAVSALAIRANP